MRAAAILRACLVVGGLAAAGCAGQRLDSQQEFEAIFACATAIEDRVGEELPGGWRFLKQEREDEILMLAWAPGRAEPLPPDYTCVVVVDDEAPTGVRVVDVDEGARPE